MDKQRENFTKTFAGVSRYDVRNYDLMYNASHIKPDTIARSLAFTIKDKQ